MNDTMAENMSFYFDDISSIDSSSRRERKYSEEQSAVIKSLTHAVQRLAGTLETKETELETTQAELKMKDRAEIELESKVLDLMILVAELKNQVVDRNEEAAFQDSPSSRQWKEQGTPATTDDFSSFQREAIFQGHNDNENEDNAIHENNFDVNSKTIQIDKPRRARRSSGLALSKLLPRNGRSLFTNLDRRRLSWGERGGGVFHKIITRHISTFKESTPDDISVRSSV